MKCGGLNLHPYFTYRFLIIIFIFQFATNDAGVAIYISKRVKVHNTLKQFIGATGFEEL